MKRLHSYAFIQFAQYSLIEFSEDTISLFQKIFIGFALSPTQSTEPTRLVRVYGHMEYYNSPEWSPHLMHAVIKQAERFQCPRIAHKDDVIVLPTIYLGANESGCGAVVEQFIRG